METTKMKFVSIAMIIVAVVTIAICSIYLITSRKMINKYDVASFKVRGVEVPSFNSALKDKKKLIYANDDNGIVTLKYDIKNINLNDVYEYLGKLSDEEYVVVNLKDTYIRTISEEKDIQIKIKITSNHLIFEYKSGIDTAERIDKRNDEKLKLEINEKDKEQSS